VSYYYSGAEVLGEARLRRASLGDDSGVLIVEGRDDLRLLTSISISQSHILPAGNKHLVLDAAARLQPEEMSQFILVVDCDYDVPGGTLCGAPHLVVTKHPATETDMAELGIIKALVLQLVPAAVTSQSELTDISRVVHERAIALAGSVGQVRQLSTVERLGLDFKNLRIGRMREKDTVNVNFSKLVTTVLQRSQCYEDVGAVEKRAAEIPRSLMTCNGHDLVESIRIVLHDDFGVPHSELKHLDKLLRGCAGNPEFLARWSVVERIQEWQAQTGRTVLTI
jgi:hypothetical protein